MGDTDSNTTDLQGSLAPLDPFGPTRAAGGYLGTFMGEDIPVITTWRGLRQAAQDWPRFSNDAPGRVPIPAEDDVRSLRQLPIETDPPLHGAYKELVKGWFRRPADHAPTKDRIAALVDRLMSAAIGPVAVVDKLALPIQSYALAALLDLPDAEAIGWIGWGTHAFRSAGRNDPARADALMVMLERYVDHAMMGRSSDFFGHLASVNLDGRALSRDEMLGYAHVIFAGGRDTVINCIAAAVAHLAETPADLERLAQEPDLIPRAVEEIVRHTSPLSHIGRICTGPDTVAGHPRAAGSRIALCFAAASHDPQMFDNPGRLQIDRNPNPHVSFGSGDHNCLGSTHARSVLRAVLSWLVASVDRIEPIDIAPGVRSVGGLVRRHGFDQLTVILHRKSVP